MYNERERLLRNRPPQIRQLAATASSNLIVQVNEQPRNSTYVAAGFFTPFEGLQIPGYAVVGTCKPFTQAEYSTYSAILNHHKPGFLRRSLNKVMQTILFRSPRHEYFWYQHRSVILFLLMTATLFTWALIFLLNPFQQTILESADDFADNFANLGQDPQEGVEKSVNQILTVVVYVAVTESIVLFAVLLGWVFDLITRPIVPFIAPFEQGIYRDNQDEPRGIYQTTVTHDSENISHDLIKAKGRWWLLEKSQTLQVCDSHYRLLPSVALKKQITPLIQALEAAQSRLGFAGSDFAEDVFGAYSNLIAHVRKTYVATDLRSLLLAAGTLAHTLQKLKETLLTKPDDSLTDADRGFLAILQPVSASNNDDDDDDRTYYLTKINEQTAPFDSAAAQLQALTKQVMECVQEYNGEISAANAMTTPISKAQSKQRFFNGVDLLGRVGHQEMLERFGHAPADDDHSLRQSQSIG